MAYKITSKYRGDADKFKGMVFDTKADAEAALVGDGWRYNGYDYEKEGGPRMAGLLAYSVMEYVEIAAV